MQKLTKENKNTGNVGDGGAIGKKTGLTEGVVDRIAAKKHFQEGERLFQDMKFKEALGEYKKALALNPNDAETCFAIAYVEQALNNKDETVRMLEKAIELLLLGTRLIYSSEPNSMEGLGLHLYDYHLLYIDEKEMDDIRKMAGKKKEFSITLSFGHERYPRNTLYFREEEGRLNVYMVDCQKISRAYNSLGNIYGMRGGWENYDKALEYFKKSDEFR